jgi:hypothetical protein
MEKSRERRKVQLFQWMQRLGKQPQLLLPSRERGKNTSGDSPSSSATVSKTKKKKKKQYVNPSLVCTPWPEDLSMRSMGKREKGIEEEEEEGRKERRGVVD